MQVLDDHIKRLNTKLQQLLKQHAVLQKEHAEMQVQLKTLTATRAQEIERLRELEQQVGILKSAAGQLEEGEKKALEKNINQYIREIDKCIGLLSE